MKNRKPKHKNVGGKKLEEAIALLRSLEFESKQTNEIAAYTLLALLNLKPHDRWEQAKAPLMGITPIIEFIAKEYGIRYAPNTRETIRDEAVKYFVEAGLLTRNPDNPLRPTNSGKTVYQIEHNALELIKNYGLANWSAKHKDYLVAGEVIRYELDRARKLSRIPVTLPSGSIITISPGGQNPLIKAIIEDFCSRFTPGAHVLYIGDAEKKFLHLEEKHLKSLNVTVPSPAKMPDVLVHDNRRNWLILIEAVTSAGPVDGKRRKELKELFRGSKAGLVFVTAFSTREAMRAFLPLISWESEVWIAESPDHLIHFNGERFLGPYDDAKPN